jgi:hypothetical protein
MKGSERQGQCSVSDVVDFHKCGLAATVGNFIRYGCPAGILDSVGKGDDMAIDHFTQSADSHPNAIFESPRRRRIRSAGIWVTSVTALVTLTVAVSLAFMPVAQAQQQKRPGASAAPAARPAPPAPRAVAPAARPAPAPRAIARPPSPPPQRSVSRPPPPQRTVTRPPPERTAIPNRPVTLPQNTTILYLGVGRYRGDHVVFNTTIEVPPVVPT